MTLYAVLKLLHILFTATWFGAGLTLPGAVRRTLEKGPPHTELLGSRVGRVVPILLGSGALTIATGFGLIFEQGGFAMVPPRIHAGLTFTLILFGITAAGLAPTLKKMAMLLDRKDGLGEARKLRAVVMSDYVWRSKRLPSLGVDGTGVADEALRSYCEEIRKWKPRVLTGLPVTLYVIALYALRNRLEFPEVQVVRPNGGKFSEVMIAVVERAFGARVRENYGSAELSTMAHDCAASRDLHLLGEIVHLEILRNGQPVEGAEMGELVITDLRNHVTPLIRYAIGDVGRFVPGRCACGFEGTRFVVDGRLVETVVTPDRLAVPGTRLVDLFLRRPEIDHVKIRQQSATLFLVEAVLAPGIDQAPEEAELAEMLGELLEHPVEVRLRVVRRIAPERNGKYCLVISNSHARFREA